MSEKKDFLNQLASDIKKPESFQEEQFEKVEKPKVNIDPKWIGAGVAALIVILVAIWFFFLRAKIEMPNFVGQSTSDVSAWVRQEGIETQGIIIKEEYNFDYDSGVIMEQSVAAGKKVKQDVKITFIASLGADPNEKVDFIDDVLSQTQSDIQKWIDDNKLTKVKFSQVYSDEIEQGHVISFNLSGVDTSDFTRSTSVTFNISRGPQPAGTITVDDFKGKTEEYVTDWAKTKKVELKVVNSYSDTVESGLVIDQNIASGKTMKEGETLTITVSKGKAIKLPDFTKMSADDYDAWVKNPDNKSVNIIEKKQYSDKSGHVLNQSIAPGKYVGEDETLTLTINLWLPRLDTNHSEYGYNESGTVVGTDYQKFVDWLNRERSRGSDMYAGSWSTKPVYSYDYGKDKILSYTCTSQSTGNSCALNGDLPLDARFDVVLSKGKMINVVSVAEIPDPENPKPTYSIVVEGLTLAQLVDTLTDNNITFKIDSDVAADYTGIVGLYNSNGEQMTAHNKSILYDDVVYIIKK